MLTLFLLILAGVLAGVGSGLFGIGGGIIITPFLVYFLGYSQQKAIATSLTALLAPVGIFAVYAYAKEGYVDWKNAVVICISMAFSAYFGARIALSLSSAALKMSFGFFLIVLGVYTIIRAYQEIG